MHMDKKKIEIEICTGTLCHVMGGSELQLLEDHLSPEQKEYVIVKGCTCLDFCSDSSKGKAPFVKINGKCLSEASIPKVLNYLKTLERNDLHESGNVDPTGTAKPDSKTVF
ncbi:MAG: hypothetical protein ACEPOW_08805 [Bacteroidales bacterium]